MPTESATRAHPAQLPVTVVTSVCHYLVRRADDSKKRWMASWVNRSRCETEPLSRFPELMGKDLRVPWTTTNIPGLFFPSHRAGTPLLLLTYNHRGMFWFCIYQLCEPSAFRTLSWRSGFLTGLFVQLLVNRDPWRTTWREIWIALISVHVRDPLP